MSTTRRAVLLESGASGPRARESSGLPASLAARGFTIERFTDARSLLDSLVNAPADVLIVDADSPWLDLREFVEMLRRDPRTARTLIVALASGDPREVPARREIALILAKPINADEAASRLEGLVVTRQKAVTSTRELRGDLSQLPLPDLLQLLSVSRATGVLTIEAQGRRGTVALDNGDLREVVCGPATGIKAFVRLLHFAEGAFVFVPQPALAGEKITEVLPLGPALFEATRQIDEIQRLKGSLPEPWVEIHRTRRAVTREMRARIQESPALAEIERLLETARTLGNLLDASALPDADVMQALDAFRVEGLLEFAGATGADRVEVLNASLAAALVSRLEETGRTVARVLVLLDPVAGSGEAALLRALTGVAGFVPTETGRSGALSLGTLGMLVSGDARVELFALPLERDLFPLWPVFGASADAAIVAAPLTARTREHQILAADIGLPTSSVGTSISPETIGAALKSAFEQLNPRR